MNLKGVEAEQQKGDLIVKILLLVVVMAFISGCTRQDTQNPDKIGKAMYLDVAVTDSYENTSIAADGSVDGNKTDVKVEVEKLSFIAYS